tara:strand:+ start:942 stop:1130 length:189 start_codon:yes stop_codon:yes gene_type:complete
MTPEQLQKKLDSVTSDLKKANKEKDEGKILHYVKQLNKLWEEASVEMLKNAEKNGFVSPDKK